MSLGDFHIWPARSIHLGVKKLVGHSQQVLREGQKVPGSFALCPILTSYHQMGLRPIPALDFLVKPFSLMFAGATHS